MLDETQIILFVDDESDIINSLKRLLRKEPYQCLFASSGDQAIELLKDNKVDVLVSDLRMPCMDGLGLLNCVMEKWPNTIRMVLSGRFDSATIIEAVNAGRIHRYIIKPWDNDELKIILRNALEVAALHKERRQLFDQLETYNRQLEEKVEERTQQLIKMRSQAEIGKYAAQIVHNLRTPLHALGGALDLIELSLHGASTIDSSELGRIVGLGRKGLTDLRHIVAGILDHARAEGAYYLEKVDINAAIQQELNFFELDPVFRKSIEKKVQLSDELPAFVGSTTQIKQVLDNLIRNAIEAMAASAVKRITINTKSDGRAIYIEVSDTGNGIAADDLPHIFSGEFTTKGKENGTGIGLSSVQRIVSTYGGTVEVDSEVGSGTTFIVRLPMENGKDSNIAYPEIANSSDIFVA